MDLKNNTQLLNFYKNISPLLFAFIIPITILNKIYLKIKLLMGYFLYVAMI